MNPRYAIRLMTVYLLVLCVESSANAQNLRGTFASGVAVYKVSEKEPFRRSGGTELILAAGNYDGTLAGLPTIILDRDYTSSSNDGYKSKDEGIFQLFNSNPVKVVSIMHRLNCEDETIRGRFFSRSYNARSRLQKDRLVVKTQFELWPTYRAVDNPVVLAQLLRGIVMTRYSLFKLKNEDGAAGIRCELRILADLLPEKLEDRTDLIKKARMILQESIPDHAWEYASKLVPPADAKIWIPTGKQLLRERRIWNQLRAMRNAKSAN